MKILNKVGQTILAVISGVTPLRVDLLVKNIKKIGSK